LFIGLAAGTFRLAAVCCQTGILKQLQARFLKIGEDAGADGLIAPTPTRSDLCHWQGRQADEECGAQARRHLKPWIGRNAYIPYVIIRVECSKDKSPQVQTGKPQTTIV
jgi:hypothetical protein